MSNIRYRVKEWLRPVVQNTRVHKTLAKMFNADLDQIELLISKLVSLVVPVWDAGEDMIIQTVATAGNATISLDVPKGKRMRVLYARCNITTDATVANRVGRLRISNDTFGNLAYFPSSANVAASSSNYCHYLSPFEYHLQAQAAGFISNVGLTDGGFIVYGGDSLEMSLDAGVAGDSYYWVFKVVFI